MSYSQKFRKEWKDDELFRKWLLEVPGEPMKARCKYCHSSFRAKLSDIKKHAKSQKHVSTSKDFSAERQSIIQFPVSKDNLNAIHETEIRQSLFIAEHCAISSIDHLVLVNKSCFQDSQTAKKVTMHRTKCSAILKNVLQPHFKKDLLMDVGDGDYSLLIDESTDISVTKYLGLVIVYYSISNEKIISTFLCLAELKEANADGIVLAIKKVLNDFNLNLQKMRGIGTDNANVMVGINNGVYKKLKDEIPSLILIRCICHSLQLAVSAAAAETLPRNIDFIISETYNWFGRSPGRIQAYKDIYKLINDGHDPLKLVQVSSIRWLSIESAVSRICAQWMELKTHFSIARHTERCYTSEILYQMYCDPNNFAYLTYLKSVLVEIQRVNKSFQAESVDSVKLLNDLTLLVSSLVKRIVLPTVSVDPFKRDIKDFINIKSYLGFETEREIEKVFGPKRNSNEESAFRQRCIDFTHKVIEQIKQRLPDNVDILKKISLLSSHDVLQVIKEPLLPLLKEMNVPTNTISKIENQWNSINLIRWRNTSSTVSFWTEVKNYVDAAGENPFQELCEFAFSMLVLPNSNAEVERIFSQLNIIKNKLRNRMGTEMVNAILLIRSSLKRKRKSCHNYEIPPNITKAFGSGIYKSSTAANSESCDQRIPSGVENCESDDDNFLFLDM